VGPKGNSPRTLPGSSRAGPQRDRTGLPAQESDPKRPLDTLPVSRRGKGHYACACAKHSRFTKAQFDAIRDIAEPRAINTLADQAEVAGDRKVAELYGISARTLQRYTTRKDARANDLEASITVKGRGFPLSEFRPVPTARGVQVTIKGRTFVIPHTFMVKRKFGRNVFARGAYGGKGISRPTGESFGRFLFDRGGIGRRHGLPINKLYTFAPPDTWSNPTVTAAMQDRVDSQAAAVLRREVAAVTRGF